MLREKGTGRLEYVRREVRLGAAFTAPEFETAFSAFRKMYNVDPQRALCAPDVLARYCEVYERGSERAHAYTRVAFRGVPLVAAIVAPGLVAFEGEVDAERMGDW